MWMFFTCFKRKMAPVTIELLVCPFVATALWTASVFIVYLFSCILPSERLAITPQFAIGSIVVWFILWCIAGLIGFIVYGVKNFVQCIKYHALA